ncbi:hypothetical protein SynPROS71_01156 [Synechococcus sp. PROS-7-1]|nr:hypothetical protein SynPROS71_01156 [Synechococcus sp. PROS-7-1]
MPPETEQEGCSASFNSGPTFCSGRCHGLIRDFLKNLFFF